jgi:DNA-binding CsgD family transcriptional regulator
MAGAVVGAIGFACFRPPLDWPEDLVLHLRLIGDIFNYSLARKHAYAALQRADQQFQAAVGQALEQKRQELSRQQEASRIRQLLDGLKPREREVFRLVAAGMANKRIAARLGVCLQTVKLHRGPVDAEAATPFRR